MLPRRWPLTYFIPLSDDVGVPRIVLQCVRSLWIPRNGSHAGLGYVVIANKRLHGELDAHKPDHLLKLPSIKKNIILRCWEIGSHEGLTFIFTTRQKNASPLTNLDDGFCFMLHVVGRERVDAETP